MLLRRRRSLNSIIFVSLYALVVAKALCSDKSEKIKLNSADLVVSADRPFRSPFNLSVFAHRVASLFIHFRLSNTNPMSSSSLSLKYKACCLERNAASSKIASFVCTSL